MLGRNYMTKIRTELFNKLCSIYDDIDFVVGVMSNAVTDRDSQAILDYIENGEDVTPENIILLSLELDIANNAD